MSESLSDLNPEQQIVAAILEATGIRDGAAVVRQDRLEATIIGSALLPVFERAARDLAAIAELLNEMPT